MGTGLISVLEAVYQSRCGKSVLMVDRQHDMGGAWLSLEIFGLHDVENAIHYFLPDAHAFDFMKNVLGWHVIESPRKYRVFPLPVRGYGRLPFDHRVGRLIGRIAELAQSTDKRKRLSQLLRTVQETLLEARPPSYYVRGGAPEMLRKVKAILLASDVEVAYSKSIDQIYIDPQAKAVDVFMGGEQIRAKTIVFTHGSRVCNLMSPSGPFHVPMKSERRPAVHLLVRDESPTSMYECIFTADPVIKYVHDVTRLTREAAQLLGRKKLFVLGLHKDVQENDIIYQSIVSTLKRVGLVGAGAVLEKQHWWDARLPPLEDADLERLKAAFGAQVEFLKTENFSRGIGYQACRWAAKLGMPATDDDHMQTPQAAAKIATPR